VLDRSGATEPKVVSHVLLRVRDVMRQDSRPASHPTMARHDLDLIPVVDDNGAHSPRCRRRDTRAPAPGLLAPSSNAHWISAIYGHQQRSAA
jgi:hypothetical protein